MGQMANCTGIKVLEPAADDDWAPLGAQAFLYFIFMVWCFLGVAIISDLFMGAIEQITASTYAKKGRDGKKHIVKVWNPTVANLSLMALGSSAPEIMLSVVETVVGPPSMYAGDLGPSTIVGSAAFNLFVISAVCVYAINDGVKKVEGTKVYALTATVSVFAYVWLVIVLMVITPDVVDSWEAALTFMFFWMLLGAAYVLDKNFFRPDDDDDRPEMERQDTRAFNKALFANVKKINQKKNADKLENKEKVRMAMEAMQPVTAATHRRDGMGWLTGRKRKATIDKESGEVTRRASVKPGEASGTTAKVTPEADAELGEGEASSATTTSRSSRASKADKNLAKFRFLLETIDVMEDAGCATLVVTRTGNPEVECTVDYQSSDITATSGKDYVAVNGTLEFGKGIMRKEIEIKIIDDEEYEKAETFRVELSNPCSKETEGLAELHKHGAVAQVTILNDDDEPGGCWGMVLRFINKDKCDLIMSNWKDQFVDALQPGNDSDDPPGVVEWTLHIISVTWKVLFALVPPPQLCGGWAAFMVALGFIALMTVLVGDLATLFGCAIALKPEINAILFVALGTSMPDLFASKTAAQADDNADNSIGNVTGSNSVNVFLGLGLPWLVAAAYWEGNGPDAEWLARYDGDESLEYLQRWIARNKNADGTLDKAVFVFPAGSLGNSVVTFSCCACVCLIVLYIRRRVHGGELGGPFGSRVGTAIFLVGLWGLYLTFSCLSSEGHLAIIGEDR